MRGYYLKGETLARGKRDTESTRCGGAIHRLDAAALGEYSVYTTTLAQPGLEEGL